MEVASLVGAIWLVSSMPAVAEIPSVQKEAGLAAVLEHQTEAVPGWPWLKGDKTPAPNLGGVIGLTLLHAYEAQRNPSTWVTLVQYADHLRTYYAPEDRLPFKADIELLVRLEDAGMVNDGRELAARWFERVRALSPSGKDEYQRIAHGRAGLPAVIGYDIALAIRAAQAVGELDYAGDLADAVIGDGHLGIREPTNEHQIASVGALLQALGRLGRPGDVPVRAAAAAELVRTQGANGSWAMNSTQATAYAVLGLAVTPQESNAHRAAASGRQWLAEHQLRDGTWATYHDGLPEPFVGPVVPLAEAEALVAVLGG